MEINDANIEEIFPVGKNSSDKNRTLIVTFSSVWTKGGFNGTDTSLKILLKKYLSRLF